VLRDVPAVFCWWYGIRPPSGSERDVVLEALVPARSLRGRRQPRVWIGVRGDRHARRIAALTPGDLAVSEGMLIGLLDRRLDPAEVTALTLHALGSRGVQGRGSVWPRCWRGRICIPGAGRGGRRACSAPVMTG
jgi:hypothetical protein